MGLTGGPPAFNLCGPDRTWASVVGLAQPVRAPLCGSGGRGFKSHNPPHTEIPAPGVSPGPDFISRRTGGHNQRAGMAELVDAPDLGSGSRRE